MKTRTLLITRLLLGSLGALLAQPSPDASRAGGDAASGTITPPARGNQPMRAPALPPLKENVTLAIKGAFMANTTIDFSWTGNGPKVANEMVASSDEVGTKTVRLNGNISETDGDYRLEYTLAVLVPSVGSTTVAGRPNSVTSTTVYHNESVTSSVLLKPGMPVIVFEQDDKKVTMTLTKPAP